MMERRKRGFGRSDMETAEDAGKAQRTRRDAFLCVLCVFSAISAVRFVQRWKLLNLGIVFFITVGLVGCGRAPEPMEEPQAEATSAELLRPPDGLAIPEGMVYVPGGVTQIGSETGEPVERPVFDAEVAPFFMDEHPVTVAQFRAFVEATGYVTEAERFGNAGVLDPDTRRWHLVDGATWHHPFGPDGPAVPDDHPVTQVSWHDAVAYAEWAGKRLPTEVEWEHAARGARNARQSYAWGTSLVEQGRHRANTWQGVFPDYNTGADGYLYTSPVGTFGATPLGLTDVGGNVWEWCQDWFRPYDDRGTPFVAGPSSEKVQRGGSFLCRGHSTPETSLFHVGFRCVKDVPSS